jgi:WD40 repeat protein
MRGRVSGIAFQSNGPLVAAATFAGNVRVWDIGTGAEVNAFPQAEQVYAVGFVPGTNHLVIGRSDSAVRVDALSEQVIARSEGYVGALGFSTDGRIASAEDDGSVMLRGPVDSMRLPAMSDKELQIAAMDPRATYLLTADLSGRIHIRRIADSTLIFPDTTRSEAVAVDVALRLFAKADSIRAVVQRAPSGDTVATLPMSAAKALAIDPSGAYLASGGADLTARVWEIASGREVSRISHRDPIKAVAFSPDGKYLLTITDRGVVTSWVWRPRDLIDAACSHLRGRFDTAHWRTVLRDRKAKPAC